MPDESKPTGGRGVWWIVAVGFGLLAMAWAAMFFFAAKTNVQSVPLEGRSGP